MHFLGCLFALVLGLLFIGIMFVGSIIDAIFSLLGIKKRVTRTHFGGYSNTSGYGNSSGYGNASGYGQDQSERNDEQQQPSHQGQQNKKIFEKNESEYVDFEEV